MRLVEAPNAQLYTHWIRNFAVGSSAGYKLIKDSVDLAGYRGEVIVLNGGSPSSGIRSQVVRLAAAGEISVTRTEV